MKILTCNIRCSCDGDGENGWSYRDAYCAEVIRAQTPDIICFQEMWEPQADYLTPAFPAFHAFGMVDEPTGRNPVNTIFYHADSFHLVSAGGYWLSERPHVPGSRSWESGYIRLANWVRLADKATGAEFRVVNTHLDVSSQAAREHQARLLVEDAAAYPVAFPQILTGDMNCDSTNAAIKAIESGGWRDTYAAIHGRDDPGPTFHAFQGPAFKRESPGKIDWIFSRGTVAVVDAGIIRDSTGNRYPSDHYFVSATLAIGDS